MYVSLFFFIQLFMLRIAVQSKGRLHDDTMALFSEINLKTVNNKRTLLMPVHGFPVEFLFLRDDDIPLTVSSGTADAGIVGYNEIMERGVSVDESIRLGFGSCRLSLAIPNEVVYTGLKWFKGKRIATSYPKMLGDFLERNHIDAQIHQITGSVEISTAIGLADAIFDIVSSGSTLVSNNLKEVEIIEQSQAVLIANQNLSEKKKAILEEIIFRIHAVKSAEKMKYVMMNAPRDKLEEILSILPGIKSPTIMSLAEKGWCSVHTVIDDSRFWEILGILKNRGAQGILVLPIEKMIL